MVFHPDRQMTKLSALYAGPYKIVTVRRNVAYIVPKDKPRDRPKSVPFERLSLCYPELPDHVFEGRPGELIVPERLNPGAGQGRAYGPEPDGIRDQALPAGH